jgi:hypothetical protein
MTPIENSSVGRHPSILAISEGRRAASISKKCSAHWPKPINHHSPKTFGSAEAALKHESLKGEVCHHIFEQPVSWTIGGVSTSRAMLV